MSELAELLSTLISGLAWITAALALATGVAAFAKLKVTPSGLLLGLGLGGVGCANLTSKIYRLAVLSPRLETTEGQPRDYAEVDAAITAMQSLAGCVNLLDGLLWILAAVGLVLLPSSLRRLAERDRGAPARF